MVYPQSSLESEPYWIGLKNRQLLLQACVNCDTTRHYPRPMCSTCYSFNYQWIKATGDATVYTWTKCYHAFHPSFSKQVPYTLITATLEEGPRLLAPLSPGTETVLSIGLKLQVEFNKVSADLTLPVFVIS